LKTDHSPNLLEKAIQRGVPATSLLKGVVGDDG
jgi:hypothetical protein